MYNIDVYFINQSQDEPYKTFTCDDAKLPETLKLVRTFVYSVLDEAHKREVRYKSGQSLYLVEPKFMTAVSKVVVNGNEFPGIPNLAQIAKMPGHNPLVGAKLKEILNRYPEIVKVGFDGHDMYTRGMSGSITLMYETADFYKMYAASQEVEKLYSTEDINTLVVLLNSTTDSGYLHIYVRGVDF